MDYTGFPDLFSVYGGAGTHLFISWTAGPLSSLTILILKHHSPHNFPSAATKCLILVDGSLNSARDLLEFKGSILVRLREIPFLCKFQQRRNVLVHVLKSRNGWRDVPTCGLLQRCQLFHDVYREDTSLGRPLQGRQRDPGHFRVSVLWDGPVPWH